MFMVGPLGLKPGLALLPMGMGALGSVLLASIYLGIVSLAESPGHALQLFWQDKVLVVPIVLGFGVQVGLYTLLKQGHLLSTNTRAGGMTTAAGGGMSTVAMVACCAHHITDVLPLLGLTAAAAFLANWRVPFMVVGLLTNLVGITVMVRLILKERRLAQDLTLVSEGIE